MKKPVKVMRAEAQEVDGRLCFVLIGKDGAGRAVAMAIPEEGLQPVFAEAAQRLTAYRSDKIREAAGEYVKTLTQPGSPAKAGTVSTTGGERVVLIVRQGSPTEAALSFSPSDARMLGQDLVRMADQADVGNQRSPRPN